MAVDGVSSISFMAALHRAVAFPKNTMLPCVSARIWSLDVVGAVDVPLEEDLGAPEVRLRLARAPLQRLLEVPGVPDDVHPFATAAEGGLHQQREADPLGLLPGALGIDRLWGAGHGRHPRSSAIAARRLVAHRLDRVGWRPDEREARVGDGLRELRTLRQEPVSRVDVRGPRSPGGVEDRVDRQV